jgi:hypothetical protein
MSEIKDRERGAVQKGSFQFSKLSYTAPSYTIEINAD